MTQLKRLIDLSRLVGGTLWAADQRGLALIVACQIVAAGTLVAQLIALRSVIAILDGSSTESLDQPLALLLAAVLAGALASVALRETRLTMSERVQRHTTITSLAAAGAVPLAAYELPAFQNLLSRATRDLAPRLWTALRAVISITTATVGVVALSGVILILAPTVLAVAAASSIPVLMIAKRNSRILYEFNFSQTAADRRRSSIERTMVERRSAAEVRALGAVDPLLDKVGLLFTDRVERIRQISRKRLVWSAFGTAVGFTFAAASILLLVQRIDSGALALSDGLVALVALQQLTVRARTLSTTLAELDEVGLYIDDYREFLEQASRYGGESLGRQLEAEAIHIDGVTFTYPATERLVLDDVSMSLGPRQMVAIVGENGSGKTTLAKVLAGIYEPDRGSVRWGGEATSAADRLASAAFVFQDFARLPLSLAENVSLGSGQDHRATIEALEAAGLGYMMDLLPDGIETLLARELDGGAEISGGEWQRVALARAFIRSRPLLVLDEPSSALDPRMEIELVERVRKLAEDRTVVYISHRFSTVRSADAIGVMSEGRLVEFGTHEQLLSLGGHYAELFNLQAASYQ